ncbi:hypothetical protein L1987_83764 [Smallanthus sonchifolius]|uniref:Uncharacterized protein n=1 Tax=Smallanthus sonchifolius TaxID=185202 RepID=A0ACB8YDI3_9ASTR|nr:hypothetical protein L1987_83764 [Smallanthus sonchifolius]
MFLGYTLVNLTKAALLKVSTQAEHFNGLLDLQKQLCGDISKNIRLQVYDVSVYTSKIEDALTGKRVFIVLDDVDCLDQLNALLGKKAFYRGSKVIITTKDASLTERCELFNLQVQPKHKKLSLNGLYKYASLELLCIHAFQSQKPKEVMKRDVAETILNACDIDTIYGTLIDAFLELDGKTS